MMNQKPGKEKPPSKAGKFLMALAAAAIVLGFYFFFGGSHHFPTEISYENLR